MVKLVHATSQPKFDYTGLTFHVDRSDKLEATPYRIVGILKQNELLNDGSTGREDIEEQIATESAHMICFDLADEKYDSAAAITTKHDSVSLQHDLHKSMLS